MDVERDPLSTFSSGLFKGRTALVTGGGRGIGRRTAFARLGARVVIASRNEQNLEETSTELREIGAEVLVVPMSIREIDQVEDLIAQTIERFGSIDFLVNNAGGQFPAPVLERGAPPFAHSGATRAGVVNPTKTPAVYLARHGVTINALAPGAVSTRGFSGTTVVADGALHLGNWNAILDSEPEYGS